MFVEELTKSVLESGLLREEAGRYVLDGALPPFAIPMTLHASLLERLDRLASVRLVAQIGAAIGREFSYELLRSVSRLPEDDLQAALSRLVTSELVFQRGTPLTPHSPDRPGAYALDGFRSLLHNLGEVALGLPEIMYRDGKPVARCFVRPSEG